MSDFATLCARLGLPPGLPYDPLWAAAPDFLERIAEHVLDSRPDTIIECSSGATTLLLARCCEINGRGLLLSLENGPEFAAATRQALERIGLAHRARVLDAPLEPIRLAGRQFDWYSLATLPECRIDMLVIDGPPGFIQPLSRYPALPRLRDRLAPDATIFLDDAARPDERALVDLWLQENPDLEHEYWQAERGCSILRRR